MNAHVTATNSDIKRNRAGLETRRKLLDATRALLSEVGLDGTTIKAICDRADVLPGSFYNQFDSKDDAVLEVMVEAINAVDPDPDHVGTDTLVDLIEAYARFMVDSGPLSRVYLQLATSVALTDPEIKKQLLRHHERRVDRFVEALRREEPDASDDARVRVETLLATLNGLGYNWMMDPKFDVAGHIRRVAAQVAEKGLQ